MASPRGDRSVIVGGSEVDLDLREGLNMSNLIDKEARLTKHPDQGPCIDVGGNLISLSLVVRGGIVFQNEGNQIFSVKTMLSPRPPDEVSSTKQRPRGHSKLPSAQDNIDMNDPAVLQLTQGLELAKQIKESNRSIFVKNATKLAPPPTNAKRQVPTTASAMISSLGKHRQGMFGRPSSAGGRESARSIPNSPSPGSLTPQLGQSNQRSAVADKIKISLIHLLAVRPVSEKYITSLIKCDPKDLAPLLEKYGRPYRLDGRKFELWDKGYKELDVWSFPYKDPEDRQAAIDRAITAFDRQRISVVEHVWQMLLPKNERGKGKILSRLNLHTGPVNKIQKPRAPKINVEPSSSAAARTSGTIGEKDAEKNINEGNDVLAPRDVGSRSQDPTRSSKSGETKAKSAKGQPKAKGPEKKKSISKSDKATAKSTNGTEAKEQASKKSGAASGKKGNSGPAKDKIKSSEFVHSSDDEDIVMLDAADDNNKKTHRTIAQGKDDAAETTVRVKTAVSTSPRPKTSPTLLPSLAPTNKPVIRKGIVKVPKNKSSPAPSTTKPASAASANAPQPTAKKKPVSASSSSTKSSGGKDAPKSKLAEKVEKREAPKPASAAMSRASSLSTVKPLTQAHKRAVSSSSPAKPSPLGSSPPANVSDLEAAASRGSAPPRTSQKSSRKTTETSGTSSSEASPLMNNLRREMETSATKSKAKAAISMNGVPSSSGSYKKAVSHSSTDGPDRRKPLKSSLDRSPLADRKRKFDDPQRRYSSSDDDEIRQPPFKRIHSTPPISSSSDSERWASRGRGDSSSSSSREITAKDIDSALDFKRQQANYEMLRAELIIEDHPSSDKVEKLKRLHAKLIAHKAELWKLFGSV